MKRSNTSQDNENCLKSIKLPIPSTFIVTDLKRKNLVLEDFYKFWGSSPDGGSPYPGGNPVSLDRKSLKLLDPKLYFIKLKTDGVRYSLLLCKDKSSFMIDRTLKVYPVELVCDESYFQGSMFEGELVWEGNPPSLYFYVFDVIHLRGISLKRENYLFRYEEVKRCFGDALQVFPTTQKRKTELSKMGRVVFKGEITCVVKEVRDCREVEQLYNTINSPNSSLKSDGIIFEPILEPVRLGTHWKQFKFKLEHTIDLQLRAKRSSPEDSKWTYGLYYKQKDETVPESAYSGTNLEKSREKSSEVLMLNACNGVKWNDKLIFFVLEESYLLRTIQKTVLSRKPDILQYSCILECCGQFEPPDKFICMVKKLRTDKSEPNNRFTIQRTLTNIEENITLEEVKNIIFSYREVAESTV